MGELVNSTFVSLDGVVNHMERWHFDFVDDESDAVALRQLRDADALLLGRRTYEVYAQVWPEVNGEYADRINAMPKYVASTTLTAPEWAGTTVLDGDLGDAVRELTTSRRLLMHGYGPIAKSLVRQGLVDELCLWINPMLAGVGTLEDTLIGEGVAGRFTLVDVQRLTSGVVILTYRPAAR